MLDEVLVQTIDADSPEQSDERLAALICDYGIGLDAPNFDYPASRAA